MNASEAPQPEHGPLFDADSSLTDAIEELLAESSGEPITFDASGPPGPIEPGATLSETVETDPTPAPSGREWTDRRVSRDRAVGVFRVDLPGLASISRSLGTTAAERLVPRIEDGLARRIRAEDRVIRIGPTTELVVVAGAGVARTRPSAAGGPEVAADALARRLQAAITEAVIEPLDARVQIVPGSRESGRRRTARI